MKPLRILVLAADANPDSISTSLVGYSHAEALAQRHEVTIVVRSKYEESVRRKGTAFREIVAVSVPGFDPVSAWVFKHILRSNFFPNVSIVSCANCQCRRHYLRCP